MNMRDTDDDWTAVAAADPYWGVLSAERFRGENLDSESHAVFFQSGSELIGRLLGFVKQHLDAEFEPRRVLDFGCGVGRLLVPLARAAQEAVGVDVAQRMIDLCRANLAAAGLHNATVVQSDDSLSRVSGQFNLVNSLIVLQHIPPVRGYALLERMFKLIEVGGIGSLQLTYAKERRFMQHEAPRARYFRRDGDTLTDLGVSAAEPPRGTITMYDYDLNRVMLMIGEIAGHPVLALPTDDDGHLGYHYVFRRAR